MDNVVVHAGSGPLQLVLSFGIEYFNGASHAGVTIARLPVRWANDNFSINLAALNDRSLSPNELDFRALAMEREFHQWAADSYPTPSLHPPEARSGTPVAVQALAELMLSGHADQARQLLHRAWPRDWGRGNLALGGEDGFWAALCHAIVDHPLWKRFDLGRLPHADLIKTDAAGAATKN
jgi:hypothetical protein